MGDIYHSPEKNTVFTQEIPTTYKSKNRLTLIIFGILFFALGLLLGKMIYSPRQNSVIFSPTIAPTVEIIPTSVVAPNPTIAHISISWSSSDSANWKTYTNSKYKYILRYPDTFSVIEEEAQSCRGKNNLPIAGCREIGEKGDVINIKYNTSANNGMPIGIQITVRRKPANYISTPQDSFCGINNSRINEIIIDGSKANELIYEYSVESYPDKDKSIKTVALQIVSGYTYKKFESDSKPQLCSNGIFEHKNNYLIQINAMSGLDLILPPELLPVIREILQTLAFPILTD